MKLNRDYSFQKLATDELRKAIARAIRTYNLDSDHDYNQIISLQAPTGAGKTIIMATLIEDILCGSTIGQPDSDATPHVIEPQSDAIFVWLSDSPSLNEQSKMKIDLKADKVRLDQCVVISEESFDMETLEDGHIYFLNTQKLSKTGRLGQHYDNRQYTIWETLDNTAREKSDRLYFIIDEAHRGMQGKEAGRATSIMQRFIKGSSYHGMRAMPVIIGMSATAARFNQLVDDCPRCSRTPVIISADKVRSSGLLKDRILVTYPDDITKYNENAVLQAATKEWMDKCKHWYQYTREQHYQNINPIFVIQVEAGSGKTISATNLDNIISIIEEKVGRKFKECEVVHTFGSVGDISINGLTVHHIEPERIEEDRRICVVLFKENLSTGWDCPRAETMMSYRHANDSTYIAQLLGRMVRTPLGSHINVDESLNEVRLYLPFFNAETVKDIVEELRSSEGEDIPVDIDEEELGGRTMTPWSVHTHNGNNNPDQTEIDRGSEYPGPGYHPQSETRTSNNGTLNIRDNPVNYFYGMPSTQERGESDNPQSQASATSTTSTPTSARQTIGNNKSGENRSEPERYEPVPLIPQLDREKVLKFINKQAYLTFRVRDVRINDYLKSLLDLASLLTRYTVYRDAIDEVKEEITRMIHEYAGSLRKYGQYNLLKNQILQMKLSVQMYDVFGEEIKQGAQEELFLTDSVLDKQCDVVNAKLGRRNYVNSYISRYMNVEEVDECKIDCILFASNEDCMRKLHSSYAKEKFHSFNDKYRKYIVSKDDKCKRGYNSIICQGDKVSKLNLSLPETTNSGFNDEGKNYYNHLYADENTGIAKIKLSTWEEGTIEIESQRPDFVCWIRNPVRAQWALTIPYQINNVTKPMFPDFIVVRSDEQLGYVIDILEPHGDQYKDSLAKAKGMIEYANMEERIGRIQMIREVKDKATGKKRYLRLDFSKGEIRDEVQQAMTTDEFDHLFEKLGTFD